MYLLDTNVISELRQGKPKASASVLAWAASVSVAQQYLSVITLMELELGVLGLERREPPRGAGLRRWLGQVRQAFAGRILPLSEAGSVICAGLNSPDPRPLRDAMIAATALEHGFTVVTRNVADFERMGVPWLNPWS